MHDQFLAIWFEAIQANWIGAPKRQAASVDVAMKVQCIDCANMTRPKSDSNGDRAMLRAGFATCGAKNYEPGHWLAVMFPRACEEFSSSPDSAKRREWLSKSQGAK